MKTRVILADDHAITRYGLRSLLELEGLEVLAEASDGQEALRLGLQHKPDVVISDIAMPGMNGIELTRALRERLPGTQIVILSMHSSSEHVYRAFDAGALGYLLKEAASEEIVSAVRTVCLGRRYLGRGLEYSERPGAGTASPLESLSARERQVLQLVVEGRSSSQIAALIHLSPKSVDTYRSRLMHKLGVADLAALVKFAVEHGLTTTA